MATTTPEAVRSELEDVTAEAATLLALAGTQGATGGPETARAALFEAAEAIAETHKAAAAELAVAWYDELREAAAPATDYLAEPIAEIDQAALQGAIAVATEALYRLVQAGADKRAAEYEQQFADALAGSVDRLAANLQKEIAAGFRDTIRENVERDDSAVGWRRHTRRTESYAAGCRFCRFLADKGAVFSKRTALFAAHQGCHCLASPVFEGDDGPKASVMQYLASKKKRTKAENKRLRDYLDDKYGPEEPDNAGPESTAGGSGGAGGGRKPPAGASSEEPDPRDREALFGPPPERSDKAAWDAYWARRRAALPASYNAADMLPPHEVEFAERMQDLGEDIAWIAQDAPPDRIDPVTGNWLPVNDFRWERFGTEWEHKALEPTTPVDAVHIERQVVKATRKGKTRVVVDVGNRPLPDGTIETLRRFNLRPERPSATALWVMSQGQLYPVDLLAK